MNETKKMINWVAGILTIVAALMIIIVLFDKPADMVSRAAASRTVALTVADKETIVLEGPEESFFPAELNGQWYVKYMDYLCQAGALDPQTCQAGERSALSAVTCGELSGWVSAFAPDSGLEFLERYKGLSEKQKEKPVGKKEFWTFYDQFLKAVDKEGAVVELETDLYGTPAQVESAAAWTAYTKDGKYLFEGLALEAYVDKRVKFLVRGTDILKVIEEISDEIVYENAWISGFADNKVTVFVGNIQKEFPVKGVLEDEEKISGQIGDLYLKKGNPSRLVLKTERITGTVLSVKDEEIEIAGYGDVPLSENFKIYRTYGVLKEQQKKDILVGYHMQEFVVAGGEICAALTTTKPDIDNIRVLVMNNHFSTLYHGTITLSCDSMAVLEYGEEGNKQSQSVAAGESVSVSRGDKRLQGGRMVFRSANEGGLITVSSIKRAHGIPVYPGHMEITEEADGLLLLNEVDLEEYLKRVVPSEMPYTYEKEALKAQAVCARTYAHRQMQNGTYSQFGAHVDDSINYQVYNNTDTYETTDAAVNETFGQLLAYKGAPVQTFYYSTSCGHGTDGSAWGGDAGATPYLRAVSIDEKGQTMDLTSNEVFGQFIKDTNSAAYESDFSMYRWNFETDSSILSETIGGVGRITGLTVTERGPGGIARTLKVVGTEGSKTFLGQSKIRSVLGNSRLVLNRNDGSTSTGWDTLPSGFLHIENDGTDENQVTHFKVYGGGYGHGVGMSQNGAQGMAKTGKSTEEILRLFFAGCEIIDIGDVTGE